MRKMVMVALLFLLGCGEREAGLGERRDRASAAADRRDRLSSTSDRRDRLSSTSDRRDRLSSTSDRRDRLSSTFPQLARFEPMRVPADNPLTPEKVALGRKLFADPRLSSDGTTSCTG